MIGCGKLIDACVSFATIDITLGRLLQECGQVDWLRLLWDYFELAFDKGLRVQVKRLLLLLLHLGLGSLVISDIVTANMRLTAFFSGIYGSGIKLTTVAA